MAPFNGLRAPNVSEFIANLNTIPPNQEMPPPENFNLEDDLAVFTNTQFFDFDLGHDADFQPPNFEFEHQDPHHQTHSSAGETSVPAPPAQNAAKLVDYTPQGEFSFSDFHAFPPPQAYASDGRPMLPHPVAQAPSLYRQPSSAGSPPNGLAGPNIGEKRKSDSIASTPYPASFDDESRIAAEEDKRRRNTAASARFRVKKKQREQALEKSAKEMADKVAAFELRISQLETENKWLKNLIMEKNDNKDDIAALWKKYREESADREGSERKDGVGTAKA